MKNGKLQSASVALAVVCLAGCAKMRPDGRAARGQEISRTNGQVSRFARQWRGRVDSVSTKGQFVVISFPLGGLPSANTRLSIYRNNAKVGEVKVTPPQQGNLTAADIVAGECQIGDEAIGER